MQKHRGNKTGSTVGVSKEMVKLLRIQATELHVIEFDQVDTRFNDCCSWQVMEGDEKVFFSTRMYERFSDVKSGVLATITVYETYTQASDLKILAAAKSMIAVLDRCASFAALAAHPNRIVQE